jgi:hypothetical protein
MAHYMRRADWQGPTNVLARIMAAAKATPKQLRFDGPGSLFPNWPLPNVWLGVSAENQRRADERIPVLLQTPAAVRFVSYEPALGPVDFTRVGDGEIGAVYDALRGGMRRSDVGGPRLEWVIVGGESGTGARPFDIAWARSTIRQCRDAGVPVFVKQLGTRTFAQPVYVPGTDEIAGGVTLELSDTKGGRMEEWPEDVRVREWPQEEVPS